MGSTFLHCTQQGGRGGEHQKREKEDSLKKTCYSVNNNVRKAGSTSGLELTCDSSAHACRGIAV